MAPRKKHANSEKPAVKEKRVKVEKSKLNPPTSIKLKIPWKKIQCPVTVPAVSMPDIPQTAAQSKAQDAGQIKVELANEAIKGIKTAVNVQKSSEDVSQAAIKKKRQRKANAKEVPKRVEETLQAPAKKKTKKVIIKKPKIIPVKKPSKKPAKTGKRKVSPPKAEPLSESVSSSLLEKKEDEKQIDEPMEINELSTSAAISRGNSSASEYPSSSSTTTCITVPSQNLTKIDETVPVIQKQQIATVCSFVNLAQESSSDESDSSDCVTEYTSSTRSGTDSSISLSLRFSPSNTSLSESIKETYDDLFTHFEQLVSTTELPGAAKQLLSKSELPGTAKQLASKNEVIRIVKERQVSIDMDFVKAPSRGENIIDNDRKAFIKYASEKEQITTPLFRQLNKIFEKVLTQPTNVRETQDFEYNKGLTLTKTVVNKPKSNTTLKRKLFDNDITENCNTTVKKVFRSIGGLGNVKTLNTTNKKCFEQIKRTVVNDISCITNKFMNILDLNKNTALENQNKQEMKDRCDQGSLKITNDQTNPVDIQQQNPTPPSTKKLETQNKEVDLYCENDSDDDDVLSLMAESFTGIDSSSSGASICTIPSDCDNQQPDPQHETTTQQPNADSLCKHTGGTFKDIPQQRSSLKEPSQYDTKTETPVLLASRYRPSRPTECQVLRGVCFFNLVFNCKRARCDFLHARLDRDVVLNRLDKLPDDAIISDYMLIRGAPDLRRQLGPLFAHQFRLRNLTRALVEMVIDCIEKARGDCQEDNHLRIVITENTLEHLNMADFRECEDLLRYTLWPNTLLCVKLLESLADAQDFVRFKKTFVKLADFMTQIGITFGVSVASRILLRVCILPFDPELVTTLWRIISNTNDIIFGSPRMAKFEEYVSMLDKGLYKQLLYKKLLAFSSHPELGSPKGQERCERVFTQQNLVQERDTSNNTMMENKHTPAMKRKYQPVSASVAFPNFKIPRLATRNVVDPMLYQSPLQRPRLTWIRGIGVIRLRPPFQNRQHPFQPRQPPFQPRQPPFQPKHPPFQPRRLFQPRQPLFQSRQPLFETRQPLVQPRQPLFQPRQPLFQPRQPLFELRQPVFQPRQPLFQPRQPPFQPRLQLKRTIHNQLATKYYPRGAGPSDHC